MSVFFPTCLHDSEIRSTSSLSRASAVDVETSEESLPLVFARMHSPKRSPRSPLIPRSNRDMPQGFDEDQISSTSRWDPGPISPLLLSRPEDPEIQGNNKDFGEREEKPSHLETNGRDVNYSRKYQSSTVMSLPNFRTIESRSEIRTSQYRGGMDSGEMRVDHQNGQAYASQSTHCAELKKNEEQFLRRFGWWLDQITTPSALDELNNVIEE